MTVLSKDRRQALTEFREGEILEAARKVFGERGFAAATVEQIAAAAGVAKGTLYLYYDSKDAIFWAALSSRFREMYDLTRQTVEAAVGVEAKIRAALQVRFDFFRTDEKFVRMYVTEFGYVCRTQQGPMHDLWLEAAQYLAGVLQAGMDAGEIRSLPATETALALMEIVKGVFIMKFSAVPGLRDDFDGAGYVFDLFWNGVRKGKEDERHA